MGLEENYCYYRFIKSNNIRLLFDSDSYVPKLNDEITIFIQSTKGSEGNFEYKEDIITNITSEKYGYDNVPVLIKPISNAQYGEDKITIDELKKIIPREAVARGSITTTVDLYNYFNTISTDTSWVDNQSFYGTNYKVLSKFCEVSLFEKKYENNAYHTIMTVLCPDSSVVIQYNLTKLTIKNAGIWKK